MIPFLAPVALAFAPVGKFLKAIPRPVWIAIGILLLIAAAVWFHKDAVSDARKAGYAQGKADEGARIAKQAAEIKRKADALTGKISQALKDKNDAQNRAIARSADDLRLSGPGKAACPRNPGVPQGSSRPVSAGGGANVAGSEMPSGDSAAVPWSWLVGSAEKCDLNRAEALTWREWYRQQSEAWAKLETQR